MNVNNILEYLEMISLDMRATKFKFLNCLFGHKNSKRVNELSI